MNFFVLLLLSACALSVPAIHAQDVSPLERVGGSDGQMDSRLAALYDSVAGKPDPPNLPFSLGLDGQKIHVVLEMRGGDAQLPSGLGIEGKDRNGNMVQAMVPVRNLEAVATDGSVAFVHMPSEIDLMLGFIERNPIIYVLVAWVVMIVAAKALRLDRYGFELKAYSMVYKNRQVQSMLTRMLGRTRRGIRVFADVSVVAGFAMMGFAFWFLISNVYTFFTARADFAELTVLVPGVTLTSPTAIAYFLLSIPIVLVMHEGAHGIVATLEKIKIKTGGFAIFIAIFAGFVEPDEEEFAKAKKISKLRVIGAGATSNVIFAFALGAILLTNPFFAIILPEPMLSTFYDLPDGVAVLSVMEGSGAEAAGMMAGDTITSINGVGIRGPADFERTGISPGDVADVSVLRNGERLDFQVAVMPSPDNSERGLIGITRDNTLGYTPILDFIDWGEYTGEGGESSRQLSMFLVWLWMISFFIGIINMLPLPILDGGKFIHSIIDQKMSENAVNYTMWGIYMATFVLFALNIALSYVKSGWFTI